MMHGVVTFLATGFATVWAVTFLAIREWPELLVGGVPPVEWPEKSFGGVCVTECLQHLRLDVHVDGVSPAALAGANCQQAEDV